MLSRSDVGTAVPGSRRALVVALCALVVLGLGLAGAPPARAHDGLLGSDPADGSVSATPPTQVVLTFSADQLALGSAVVVTGPDGVDRTSGAAVVSGATLTQALSEDLPAGVYAVAWRSVAGDGHPVEGTFSFTLDVPAGEAPPEPDRSEAATPTPTGAETGPAGEEVTPTPTEVGDETSGPGPVDPGSAPGGPLVTGALLLAAVAGAAVLLVRRARG